MGKFSDGSNPTRVARQADRGEKSCLLLLAGMCHCLGYVTEKLKCLAHPASLANTANQTGRPLGFCSSNMSSLLSESEFVAFFELVS